MVIMVVNEMVRIIEVELYILARWAKERCNRRAAQHCSDSSSLGEEVTFFYDGYHSRPETQRSLDHFGLTLRAFHRNGTSSSSG